MLNKNKHNNSAERISVSQLYNDENTLNCTVSTHSCHSVTKNTEIKSIYLHCIEITKMFPLYHLSSIIMTDVLQYQILTTQLSLQSTLKFICKDKRHTS